ncbi:hypothetical protein TNCV_2458371 [Trichonephila clavipes]|nr:hypothetical protein TNCV_2458371 [Trichonephila clavipes]
MFDSSSYDNPTPLAHADASRDVFPRGGTSQFVSHPEWATVAQWSRYSRPACHEFKTSTAEDPPCREGVTR